MKKLFYFALISIFAIGISSCGDDEAPVTLDPPTLTVSPVSVQVGGTIPVVFTYTAAGEFASSGATPVNGTASISTDGVVGETGGTITVDFTAGDNPGDGSVVLTITDGQGISVSATAVITISASAVPSIEGISSPGQAAGNSFTVAGPITITAEDGFGTPAFWYEINDGGMANAVNLSAMVEGQSSPVTIDNIELDLTNDLFQAGVNEVTFNTQDADGDRASVTLILTIEDEVTISENITEDMTWFTGVTYILDARIVVESGATLTIQPGVVVKGEAGQEANATALIIARGATLNAMGTATLPIIFTGVADQISPENIAAGEFASPNLTPAVNNLWGGLIILGNAPISADTPQRQIEGIPPSDPNGLYGGDDDTESSGTIRYISIRHGGTNIGEGNEINGLTLGGVGSGTTIEFVEVVGNQDDGIEWFGGSVNVTNALVWNSGDDALDTDQDWTGTCDNFIIITPVNSAFELDGPEGATASGNDHSFINGTVNVGNINDFMIDFDNNTNADLSNIYFFNILGGQGVQDGRPASSTLMNIEATLPDGGTAADLFGGIAISEVAEGQNTVGADASAFSWTFAQAAGAIDNF